MIDWPPRIPLASLPTPLHYLSRWSQHLDGPDIWIKRDDLTGSVLSGNKVRKLEFTLGHALAHQHDVVITCGGLQSNHCRATAFAAAQLGLKAHLVLRGETNDIDGNLLLDYLAGAEVSMVPLSDYQQGLSERLESVANDYKEQGHNPYIIPTGASNGVGVWGYFTAADELKNNFIEQGISPDLIVTATGSGGTQAGLTLGSHWFGLDCPVLGMAVCDDSAYFQAKVRADLAEFESLYAPRLSRPLPKPDILTNDHHVGKGYGLASESVLQTIYELAAMEGILLDPVYTGKAFHGLSEEIRKGSLSHLKTIIFVHTGGGWGIFPWREPLKNIVQTDKFF